MYAQPASSKTKTAQKKATSERVKKTASLGMPLKRENYVFLGYGIAGILISYVLMIVDNNVDGFISITLCPILLVASYAWIVFAILYRKSDNAHAAG
jgi:hypothetical protein